MTDRKARWRLVILLVAVGVVVASFAVVLRLTGPRPAQAVQSPEPPAGVAALGHIEPQDGSVRLGARSLTGQASIVGQLRVKEGDAVKAGQVIAILDSRDQLAAAVSQAESSLRSAEARLAQARAGAAKSADLTVQQAEIARATFELTNAQAELRRTQKLHEGGLVSDSAFETARLVAETRTAALAGATERLRALQEVRPVDVEVIAAEVAEARAAVARARSEDDAATLRSPIAGRVVRVFAWPGAEVGPGGVVEIAGTETMFVIAEVAQSDIARVALGQRARITGDGLPAELTGTVDRIGTEVARNAATFDNPRTLATTRIVEVRLALDPNAVAERLLHAQVEVRIAVR